MVRRHLHTLRRTPSGPGSRARISVRRAGLAWQALAGVVLCSCAGSQPGATESLDPSTEVAPFVEQMVSRHGFERAAPLHEVLRQRHGKGRRLFLKRRLKLQSDLTVPLHALT